jgi:hypothetical protein
MKKSFSTLLFTLIVHPCRLIEWLKDGSIVEVNGMILVSNNLALPFWPR